jgi:hypothetical protein
MATIIFSAILTVILAVASFFFYQKGLKTKIQWKTVVFTYTEEFTYLRKKGKKTVRTDNRDDWFVAAGFSALGAVISLAVCIFNIF